MSHSLIIRTKETLYEYAGSRLLKNLFAPNSNLVNMVLTKCTKESTIISRISVKKITEITENYRKISVKLQKKINLPLKFIECLLC